MTNDALEYNYVILLLNHPLHLVLKNEEIAQGIYDTITVNEICHNFSIPCSYFANTKSLIDICTEIQDSVQQPFSLKGQFLFFSFF